MADKIIRSHRARVKQANETLENHPRYRRERISIFDREAFVEFFLLEDILKLYKIRLKEETDYIPQGKVDEKGKQNNIIKFSAIINVFNAAIGAARSAINSGDYKKVWQSIPEWPLMWAANSVKRLPELRKLAIDMLRDLSEDTLAAESVSCGIENDLEELEIHEENVRKVQDIPLTMEQIEQVIKAAEEAIPDEVAHDKRRNSRLNSN